MKSHDGFNVEAGARQSMLIAILIDEKKKKNYWQAAYGFLLITCT